MGGGALTPEPCGATNEVREVEEGFPLGRLGKWSDLKIRKWNYPRMEVLYEATRFSQERNGGGGRIGGVNGDV
jgi:hypothetical protein